MVETGKTMPVSNGKSSPLTSQELVELYKKLNDIEDSDSLQKIVDIVENSGSFEISSTEFEFDLCVLDAHTLNAIKQFIYSPT